MVSEPWGGGPENITLNAAPATGKAFTSWSLSGSDGTFTDVNDATTQMTNVGHHSDRTITANYGDIIPPTITTVSLTDGAVGVTYKETLTATGSKPIVWSVSGGALPDGLTLSAVGAISGTPTTKKSTTFTIKAASTDGTIEANTKEFTIKVIKELEEGGVTLGTGPFTYNKAKQEPTVTVTDDLSILIKDTGYTVEYGDNIKAGDSGTVTVHGTGEYYGTVTKPFNIERKPITATVNTEGVTKGHDGNTAISGTQPTITFGGIESGDVVTARANFAYDDAGIGTGKTIKATTIVLGGADEGNYTLTSNEATGSGGVITLAKGPVAPTDGIVNDEENTFRFTAVVGQHGLGVYEYSTDAGIYWDAVIENPIKIGNNAIATGYLQVRIKATATVEAGQILANTIPFIPTLMGSVTMGGILQYGEIMTATASGVQAGTVLTYQWKVDGNNVGTGSTYSIAGADIDKESISIEVTATGYDGKLTADIKTKIEKRAITVTAIAASKKYGEEDPLKLSYVISEGSLANSDERQGSLQRAPGEDVGEYEISIGTLGKDDALYDVKLDSALVKFTIEAAAVDFRIELDPSTQIEGGKVKVTVTAKNSHTDAMKLGTSLPTAPALSYLSGGGAVNVDLKNVGNGVYEAEYTAPETEASVTFTATCAPDTNYIKPTDITALLTITDKELVNITVTVDKSNVIYGEHVTYTAIMEKASSGAVNTPSDSFKLYLGDPQNGGEELTSGKNVAFLEFELDKTKLTAGNHFIYAVYSGDTNFATATGHMETVVHKAEIIVKAEDKAILKNGALPEPTIKYSGFVEGEDETRVITNKTYKAEYSSGSHKIGVFPITIAGSADAANYSFKTEDGKLTITNATLKGIKITKAPSKIIYTAGEHFNAGGMVVRATYGDSPGDEDDVTSYIFAGIGLDTTVTNVAITYIEENVSFTTYQAITVNPSSGGGGSGGGGGGGGGGGEVIVTPPAPAPEKPDAPIQGEINVDGKVDEKGNADVNIVDKDITDVIDKITAEAKKNGDETNGITLVIKVNTGNKSAKSVTINLPKTVQESIIRNKIKNTILVVNKPGIQIGMNLDTIKEINRQAQADVMLTVTSVDNDKLSDNAKVAIGMRPVFDFKASYGNNKLVSNFGTGTVSVAIAYTLSANENEGNICGVYVDENGRAQLLKGSTYDNVAKVMRFSTNHFSVYGVGYKGGAEKFVDIDDHWAKADIEYVASVGLFGGTAANLFSPNIAMTRGMFVTALGRMAGVDKREYKNTPFADVSDEMYYAPYIAWAADEKIVMGTSLTTFAPDEPITRQDMALIMRNYALAMGYIIPKTWEEMSFADNSIIGSWAIEAVKSMQQAGVIRGREDNSFDPTGIATRAEVSKAMHNYIDVISDIKVEKRF